MTLGEFRAAVAAALAPLDADWPVYAGPVDAVEPPAFMLVWGDTTGVWLTPASFCTSTAQLEVICIAGRLEPDVDYATLEAMVAAANQALDQAPDRYSVAQTAAPAAFDAAAVHYLAARILVRHTVDIPGGR